MKLLLATEANEGMGHIAPWAAFVDLAMQEGIQVHMAAPNTAQLDRFLGRYLGMNVWQAPILRFVVQQGQASPKSWPELLVSLGYGDSDCLTGAVKAWVNILKSLAPDVVLADYAPALMIAAKACGIRLLEIGSGFCVPPLLKEVCSFPGARANSPAVTANVTNQLVSSFGTALQAVGCSTAMNSFGELALWPEKRIVTSPPELDHYGARDDVLHIGFLSSHNQGVSIKLAQQENTTVVVGYLKAATPGLEALIADLREASVSAFLVIPDCNEKMANTQEGVTITRELVDLPSALKQADIYLSNGGLHGVGQALRANCWPVVVPMQAEQVAMARRIVKNSWGSLWMAALPNAARQSWHAKVKSENHSRIFQKENFKAEKTLLDMVLT
ncbi:MAG: hypothetical protein WBK51_03840 [Polaromonas sp.]